MSKTKIEWTHRPGTRGESWNFIGGCTKASDGCTNCYALRDSWRMQHNPKHPARYDGVVELVDGKPEWTGRINIDREAMQQPLRWQKPRTVFVCSMSDLFHGGVSENDIIEVFDIMIACPQHTFLVLTKRADRMRQFVNLIYPLLYEESHIWLGVTAENQKMADRRIPLLLQTPAAVRFVSVEPMLENIKLGHGLSWKFEMTATRHGPIPLLNWLIIGAESGTDRRFMEPKWALSLVEQGREAGIPTFVKQIHLPDGTVSKNPDEWPVELQIREWAEVEHAL